MIAPEFVEKSENKEAIIDYDDFQRKFFREYFHGNNKITILFKKNPPEQERKKIYSFLQKFINVQIIEESNLKIIVKCFMINDLSIEECLKRMHFLVLNMFDEKEKTKEIRNTITRFYYMLVMQVRRFLSEGKFTKENEIPLIKVLDFRMNAEKIQRIAGILSTIKISETHKDLLKETKEYYSKAFNYFNSNNYEKALLLWQEGTEKQKKVQNLIGKANSIKDHKELTSLYQIITYAKEISMLVR